jgi:hypothetical protein
MPNEHRVDEDLCFVIMPFDASFAAVHQTIKGVVKDYARVKCVRADEISQSTQITDDIFDYIQRARFLVADVTGSNPNVFYEVGAFRALEKNVILLLQEGSEAPFDIRDIRYIRYSKSKLPDLAASLKEYVKGCLCTLPTQWRTSSTTGRPDVRISHLEHPPTAIVGEPVRITAHAKNFGTAAEQAYVSLSFPSGPADPRILGSDIQVKLGKKSERWKAGQEILRYSIAEMQVYRTAGEIGWKENISHRIEVEFTAPRAGLFQFYLSASSKNAGQEFSLDPMSAAFRDQRDEPVYCGVIEIQDRTAGADCQGQVESSYS